jgi:hypothetical protein
MTWPNFLLVGAAKAGTSSVFAYLGQHPEVFVSPAKEPNYFALAGQKVAFAGPGDTIVNEASITDERHYRALFRGGAGARAVGEASTLYLYAPGAAAAIRRDVPDVRIIAILRDPVERAYSSFLHMRRDGRETVASFEEALELEESRIDQRWEHLWHYTRLGHYHAQLQRYYALFPREQFRVWLYDDLEEDPRRVLREVFEFLGVDPTFEPDMSIRHKVAGTPRSKALHAVLTRPNPAKSFAKRLLPAGVRSQVYGALMHRNVKEHRESMRAETRQRLQNLFRGDVERLSVLLERDLSAWNGSHGVSR